MMILFSLHGDAHYSNIGALLCFVNILFYATYLLITRAISPKYSPVTMMKWMFLFSFVFSLPLAIPTVKDSPLLMGTAPAMAYVNMGIVAVFATVVAYYLLPAARGLAPPSPHHRQHVQQPAAPHHGRPRHRCRPGHLHLE